jgi:hypothetical protein
LYEAILKILHIIEETVYMNHERGEHNTPLNLTENIDVILESWKHEY